MDTQSIYLETRGATGGDEAKIWASDLLRMYYRYALIKGWKTSLVSDGVLKITGVNVFNELKNEAGVHRVQRIPKTERHGRLHTSTATVAILPEINESDIKINTSDLEWDFFRASSQGGQNVQKVSTAVRLKHKPSGIIVQAQRERFQEQNRIIALGLLRSKLWEASELEKEKTVAGYRSAVGRGMRSEKIKTYNFPQDRLTDHRLSKSWGNLEDILEGNLTKVIALSMTLNY